MNHCDLTYLKNVTPGNNAFAIQIIQLFLNDTPVAINVIKENIQLANWKEVYANAHRIKPSFTLVGIPKETLETLLQVNEISKSEINTNKLFELFPKLETELLLVYEDLKQQLTEIEITK